MKSFLPIAAVMAACLMIAGQTPIKAAPISDDEHLDYSQLYNNTYSYADLLQAKALDPSDDLIARMLKLARLAHRPFSDVAHMNASGLSIAVIASQWGVDYNSLRNIDNEKDEIAAYISAYEATGKAGFRRQTIAKNEEKAMRRGMK